MSSEQPTATEIFNLFVNRIDAYAMQQGDGTYQRINTPVNIKLIEFHLKGELTVGLYQLDAQDRVKWICWDIDDRQDCKEIADRIAYCLKEKYAYTAYIEASGSVNSLHVWLFLNPVPAKDARAFGAKVLNDLNLTDIELFPKQDSIGQDGYGNLVKLPLGIHRKNGNRSTFLNPLDDVKVHDLPVGGDNGSKQSSSAPQGNLELEQILSKLRPCMQKAYTEKWNLHGIKGEGQAFRFAVATEMIELDASNQAIHEYFKLQNDYKKTTTKRQIDQIRKKEYTPTGCDKLRKKCKKLLEGICESCPENDNKTDGKKKEGQKTTLSISQVMELQNWGYNGRIVAPLCFDKEFDGKRTFLQYIVYWEDRKIKEQRIASAIFIPPTGPTPKILELVKNDSKIQDTYKSFYKAIDRHVYFTDDIHYKLVALGAISTYFREVFNSYPYFDFFSALVDVGKTQAMQCMIWLSYCGFNTVNPTESVLFRAVDESHAAVGIDEVGKLFRDPKQNREILTLLLTGYKRGLPAYRMNMDTKPPRPVAYDSFGLKAFTRKEPIPRDLESRAITIHMMANNYRKVIEQHITPDEFSDLRDVMYAFRLRYSGDVKKVYLELQKERILDGRIAELYLPLLSIAKLISEGLYQEVLEYARRDEAKKSDIKNDSSFIDLVRLLWDGNYEGDIKVVDIRAKLREAFISQGEDEKEVKKWLSSQWVISKLRAMGFQRSLKRTDGNSHYAIDRNRLKLWHEDLTTIPDIHSKQTSLNLINDSGRTNIFQNEPHSEGGKNEVGEGEKSGQGIAIMRLNEVQNLCMGGGGVDSGLSQQDLARQIRDPLEQSRSGKGTFDLMGQIGEFGKEWGKPINSTNKVEFVKWCWSKLSGWTPEDIEKAVDYVFKITPSSKEDPHFSYLCKTGSHKDCGGFECYCDCHKAKVVV